MPKVSRPKIPPKRPKTPAPRKNQKKRGTTALHDLREAARRLVTEEQRKKKIAKKTASSPASGKTSHG